MFFRTAFAFAIVSAVSASLMAWLGGMVGLSVYWALIRFAVGPHGFILQSVGFDFGRVGGFCC